SRGSGPRRSHGSGLPAVSDLRAPGALPREPGDGRTWLSRRAVSAEAGDLCPGVLVLLHPVTGEGGLDEPVRAVGDDEDLARVLQSEAFDGIEEVMLVRAGGADLVDLRPGLDDLLTPRLQGVLAGV